MELPFGFWVRSISDGCLHAQQQRMRRNMLVHLKSNASVLLVLGIIGR